MDLQEATDLLNRNAMIISELRASKGALLTRAASVIDAQLVVNESLRTGFTSQIEAKKTEIEGLKSRILELSNQITKMQAEAIVKDYEHLLGSPLPQHNYD